MGVQVPWDWKPHDAFFDSKEYSGFSLFTTSFDMLACVLGKEMAKELLK